MKAPEKNRKKKWWLGAVILGLAMFGLVGLASAEDAPFRGKTQMYTYEIGVKPNVVFGVTDTITMTRWAYGWEDGKYKNCTTTAMNSCPAACGPPVPAWGANPAKYYCPSYHYGLQPYTGNVNFNNKNMCKPSYAPF